MIEGWLAAIRDHPGRPPSAQRHVLTMLALRLDWKSGTGYASTAQVAADSDTSTATVKRATGWARQAELLLQTRRGHRLGNGQVAASEWKLCQRLIDEPLTSQGLNGGASTAQPDHLNGSPQTPHQESSTSESSSSAPRAMRDQLRDQLAGIDFGVTDDEMEAILKILEDRGARSPAAVLATEIRDGNGAALIAEARQLLAPALRLPRFTDLCLHCGTAGHTARECTQ